MAPNKIAACSFRALGPLPPDGGTDHMIFQIKDRDQMSTHLYQTPWLGFQATRNSYTVHSAAAASPKWRWSWFPPRVDGSIVPKIESSQSCIGTAWSIWSGAWLGSLKKSARTGTAKKKANPSRWVTQYRVTHQVFWGLPLTVASPIVVGSNLVWPKVTIIFFMYPPFLFREMHNFLQVHSINNLN